MKKYYISSKGGLGFNIALARFIQTVSPEKYSFRVMSPYYDIFQAAKIETYTPNEVRDFILDAVNDPEAEIIEHRLYDMDGFIKKQLDYQEAWRILCKIPKEDIVQSANNLLLEKVFPETNKQVEDILNKIGEKFIIVQFWGGQSPLNFNKDNVYKYDSEPLKRHYPIKLAQEFVDKFREKYTQYKVIQYTLPNEPQLNNTEHFTVPYLVYYELAKKAKCAITIDSSLQHLISGVCPLVCIWGHTLPSNFGYSCNKNIIQKCRRDNIFYFTELGASGAKVDYIPPVELLKEVEEEMK